MTDDLKKHGKDITKLIPKYVKTGSVPAVTSQEIENQAINHAKEFLSQEYSEAEIKIINAEDSQEPKASQALPAKPAILIKWN